MKNRAAIRQDHQPAGPLPWPVYVLALCASFGTVPGHAQNRPAVPVQGIYTCVDAYGRRLTADRPIVECLDREQRVLGRTGSERGRLGPSLTEQELQEQEVRRRAEQAEHNRMMEERRRDRAMLARYPNQAVHDLERDAVLTKHDSLVQAASTQIAQLRGHRKVLEVELEFFQNDLVKAPLPLQRKFAENSELVEEQLRFIANQEKEKRKVNQRFDAELNHLRRLWVDAGVMPREALPTPKPAPESTVLPAFNVPTPASAPPEGARSTGR